MIPQEINERLCKLMYDVWRRIDPNATTANDCHCNRGGLWKSPHYGPDDFRNDGKALEFVELAVAEKLARMDVADTRKRPWAADGEALEATEGHWSDFAGWQQWMSRQEKDHSHPGDFHGEAIRGALELQDEIALYAICCRLADGEGSE